MSIDLATYLRRVGLAEGDVAQPTVAALRRLHRAHVDAIPFANLDAALGRVPDLGLPALQERMVARACGGYCMEHVTLFAAVLEAVGFPVELRLCLVGTPADPDRPPTHLTVLARPEDDPRRWMADVGFGVGVLGPVPLPDGPGEGEPMRHGRWVHRADIAPDGRILLMEEGPDGWRALHASRDEDVPGGAIDAANAWVATQDGSPFAGRLVAMRTTDDERLRLRGTRLEVVGPDGEPRTSELAPEEALDVLGERFGVTPGEEDRAALARLLRHPGDRR